VLIATLLATSGCTKTIDVPRDQYEEVSLHPEGSYRIRMKANTEYLAYQFSVTDTTLVISRLSPLDDGDRKEQLPITLRLDDVESVARVETNHAASIVIIAAGFAIVALVIHAGTQLPYGY
jgi:hypothetical protein